MADGLGPQPGAVGGHKVHRAAKRRGADPKIKNPDPGKSGPGFLCGARGKLFPRAATGGIATEGEGAQRE